MKGGICCSAAIVALCLAAQAWADNGNLRLEGNFRARGEVIDGQYRAGLPADDTALFTRLDLFGEYSGGPFRLGAEILDLRAHFHRRHGSVGVNDVDAIEPIQAYVSAEVAPGTSIQAGRFTMDLGSRRLAARPINRNSFNSFTGLRADWKTKGGDKLTLFWTLPQIRLPEDQDGIYGNRFELDRETTHRQFFGITGTRPGVLNGTVELYLYRFVESDAPHLATRDRRLWTPGIRLFRAPKSGTLDYDVEGAWQTGTTRSSASAADIADRRVSAWLVHGAAGWSFSGRGWMPRLAVLGDYASGDGPGATFGRFDTLIGDSAFEFSPSGLFAAVSRTNLASAAVRAEFNPSTRLDAHLTLRGVWLASPTDAFANSGVRDPSGAAGDHVGTQIDGRVRYWLAPGRLQLGAGFAVLLKGRFLRDAPNAPATGDTHYGFTDLTVSF